MRKLRKHNLEGFMAKPIKETPVLEGKEAERFIKEVRANEKRKVSNTEYRKALSDYRELKKFKIL